VKGMKVLSYAGVVSSAFLGAGILGWHLSAYLIERFRWEAGLTRAVTMGALFSAALVHAVVLALKLEKDS